MSFLSGSAQSTGSVSNMLDFSPVFNIGDGNKSAVEKTTDYTTEQTARLDNSLGLSASVGVGVGGNGSGGTASLMRTQEEDYQPSQTGTLSSPISNKNLLIVGGGGVALVGGYFLVKKLKKL